MADRLSIYNGALRLLGERPVTLSENREPRHLLDDVWDGGGIKRCLAAGQWNWAARKVQMQWSASITPAFGYRRGFEAPTDIDRLLGVSSSADMTTPLTRYEFSNGIFYADLDDLYIRYVSNDPEYGADISMWPEWFAAFVEAHFASEIAPKLTASDDKAARMLGVRQRRLEEAQSVDAMSGPSKRPPMGSWARARMGGGWGRENG